MNKFLSKVVATALLSTIAIYAANGPVWEGHDPLDVTKKALGGDVVGGDVNLTMHLNADMQTNAHFDLVFINGGVEDTAQYTLCNGDTLAGTYVTARDKDDNGLVTAITFEFEDNETIIKKGQVLNVISGSSSDCNKSKNVITILPYRDSCVTVKSENGQDQSGNVNIAEINSKVSDPVIKYRPDIAVACGVPTCVIANDELQFTDSSAPAAVNYRTPQSTIDENTTVVTICTDAVDCNNIVAPTTYRSCTTKIAVKNRTDYNITGLALALNFKDIVPEGMKYVVDVNGTDQNATVGEKIVVQNINIGKDVDQNITVKFVPDGEHKIPVTSVGATISKIKDANNKFKNASFDVDVAEFKTGAHSDFTVTYMNKNFKSFAMITAKADTPLTATITDNKGNTAEADCGTIKANNTTFIFSDKKEHANSCLVKAAEAKGLTNAWSVTFHVKAAVDVAAYMDTGSGERTLTVLYPQVNKDD